MFIYILSDHAEDGAENVVATIDRGRLHALIDENWSDKRFLSHAHAGLTETLKRSDEELCRPTGHNLMKGWGGAQLHVVRLR